MLKTLIIQILFVVGTIASVKAQVVISEVYANGSGDHGDYGKEWFEIYNIGSSPVDLSRAIIRRLDGVQLREAWRFQLPESMPVLSPQQYAVIAQKRDLGVALCFDTSPIVVSDPVFTFKNAGFQSLCIKPREGIEDCGQFSNSAPFPDGHSRYNQAPTLQANDDLYLWRVEDCMAAENMYASPGMRGGFCTAEDGELKNVVPCDANYTTANVELVSQGQIPRFIRFDMEPLDRGRYHISYEVIDSDSDDAVAVSFYSSATSDFREFVSLIKGAPLNDRGAGQFDLDSTAIEESHRYILGEARDRFGNEAWQWLMLPEPQTKVQEDIFQFDWISARMGKLKNQRQVQISWKISSPTHANIMLYAKDTGSGHMRPIAAGIKARAEAQSYLWIPAEGDTLEAIEITAAADHEHGRVLSSSCIVEQDAQSSCSCLRGDPSKPVWSGLLLLLLFAIGLNRIRLAAFR